MFNVNSIYFCLQLLLCENALLYGCEKRKYFWIREAISLSICVTLSYFFPIPSNLGSYYNLYMWLRFLVIFAYTCVQAFVCYKIKILPLLTFCTSGYVFQHCAFHILNLIKKIPFGNNYTRVMNTYSAYFELASSALFAVFLFFTLGNIFKKRQYYKNYNVTLSIISIISILIVTGITRLVRSESRGITMSSSLYVIVISFLIAFFETTIYQIIDLANENKVLRRMRESDRNHFEIAKSTIENINIKAHDLKHILSSPNLIIDEKERENILNTIQFYDELKTGNKTIDVILMDYKLRYSNKGVSYTFNGNAESLSFVRDIDLASIFGNAIANASEAVAKIDNEDMRVVSITLEEKGDLIFVTFRNYFEGKIKFNGRFPETSKTLHKIDHGYGIKSIYKNIQKYNGDFNISIENNIFILSVYFCKVDKQET